MASSFNVTLADLNKILLQIKVAEQNAGNQDLNTGLPTVAGVDLVTIIGPDAALLPVGLRTVSGVFNHLLPGQSTVGAADQPFPRLLTQELRTGSGGGVDFNGDGIVDFTPANGTNYNPTGSVVDSQPRTISNLIVDQSINNPAAVEAWFNNPLTLDLFQAAHPGMTPIRPGQVPANATELPINNTDLSVIPNRSPDIGLSPQFNGFMTFFGQFFDHGLDLVPKGGNGNVYIPLMPDDPLFKLPTIENPNPQNFMVISRLMPNAINITTPFVDQNQTYTSHASHQVFLREYAMDGFGHPMATGHLLAGANHGLPTWADVKAQAADLLGIQLVDADILKVPLLATDEYGRFIRGTNGFVQIVTATGLVEANPADNGGAGTLVPANVVPAGTAFLDDIAHNAVPKAGLVADADNTVSQFHPNPLDPQQPAGTYDDELLNQHFITGDGRGNENIGLTTVHTVFHNEHDRLVEAYKATILASGDLTIINEWLATDLPAGTGLPLSATAIAALNWDGERLFQAGRFVTEMQYQHLVFEEFARKVQPNVNPFVFTNSADLNPAIVAEFAHTVYRFGHSMLDDTVDRLDNDLTLVGDPAAQTGLVEGANSQIGLIEAFLNPVAFSTNSNGSDGTATADDITAARVDASVAAGAILRGMSRQAGNEIDEFVVDALRNNLVGLPLDLASINMARGRDAGVPTLNHARTELYAMTSNAQLKPYVSWFDFAQNIKHPESILNFIAAYGTHSLITAETTLAGKRAAAMHIVFGAPGDTLAQTADFQAFLTATGIYAPDGTGPHDDSHGGLDNVDLWIGGLAEEKMEFGGMLGSTFNAVFEYQMEHLQNGDRFYYLSRTQGMDLLNQLEPSTFSDLVMRNTDLRDVHSTHISGVAFDTPDLTLELDKLVAQEDYDAANTASKDAGGFDVRWASPFQQIVDPKVVRINGTVDVDGDGQIDGNVLKFSGGEHVTLGGTEGNDSMYGDKGIDTLWGDGGNDYLNAGMESDQVFGGDGDDIIEDPFGDNFLRGNNGNDVISTGQGLSLLFGDAGNDFITTATDITEIFGGEGDDFILGGAAADGLLGNAGNDWIEGGEGFDGLSGENSDLFFNSPIIGHDVLNGQGNDTDYDGESGDDIMFLNAGITRANGMLGFDWVINKGDTAPEVIDLGISRFVNQQALTLRDRNDAVEGASGWKFNDTILGTNAPTGAVGAPVGGVVGGPVTDSMLLSQNVSLINGLDTLLALTPGALRGQTVDPTNTNFASLAKDTTVFNPQTGGDILLGGGGSDLIFGKAGNDIIDGDRWLNVRIAVHSTVVNPNTGLFGVGDTVLFSVDSLNEIKARMLSTGPDHINPGQLKIVRELVSDSLTTNGLAVADDVALYAGNRADYTITRNANGTVTVTDNNLAPSLDAAGLAVPLLNDEGTDTLSNIEILRFTNRDAAGNMILINGKPTTDIRVDALGAGNPATGAPVIGLALGSTPTQGVALTATTALIGDPNGLGTFSFQWQVAPVGTLPGDLAWAAIAGATAATFTPGATEVNQILRVVVSFTDGIGTLETVTSAATPGVGALFNGRGGADTPVLTAFDDVANGLGGADVLNGGAGNDTLSGGRGNDTVLGGAGNDRILYTFGDRSDSIDGGTGTDTLAITGTANNEILDVVYNGTSITQIENGGSIANVEAVTADLLGASDRLSYGTATSAAVTVTLADAAIVNAHGSASGFAWIANISNVTGGNGNDNLTGNADANRLDGGAGADTFFGFTGTDSIIGGTGTDTIALSATSADLNAAANGQITGVEVVTALDALAGVNISLANQFEGFTVHGSNSNDTLTGGQAANTINGNNGADAINGLGGADTLNGGAGNDTINGGTGSDVINGGTDNDSMTGGTGIDRFVFTANFGNDRVTDFHGGFNAGAHDTLDFAGLTNRFTNFADMMLHADSVTVGGDAVIHAKDAGGISSTVDTITLTGVSLAQLATLGLAGHAADFNF